MKFLFRPIVALAWRCPCCSPPAATRNRATRRVHAIPADPHHRQTRRARAAADGGRKKSFGDYAAHYAVITDFNSGMDASVKPLNNLMQKGGMRTLSDIVARRDDLKTVQTALNDMGTALKEQQGKADAARAQLKQPDDLKAVYAKAYERP